MKDSLYRNENVQSGSKEYFQKRQNRGNLRYRFFKQRTEKWIFRRLYGYQGWGEVFKKNLFKEDRFWEDDSLKIDLYKKIFKNMEKEKILGRKRGGKKRFL